MRDRRRRVAFAASRDALDLDDGWPLLRAAATDVGLEAAVAVWEDDEVDWGAFELVVAMYAWGYVARRARFLAWAATVARHARLANREPILVWNSDKAYLADLAAAGVWIVPTTWVPPGETWRPPARDYVIKPTVASGGIDAARYLDERPEVVDGHVARLHAQGQTVMVQPYVPAVDANGETAVIFIGDRFSHAVGKRALLLPNVGTIYALWETQVITPREPRADELLLAEQALRVVHDRFGASDYARVDIVDDADGTPMVIELELIEPSLFLDYAPTAAARLAQQLHQRLTGPTPKLKSMCHLQGDRAATRGSSAALAPCPEQP